MIEFGESVDNPLLQLALLLGEEVVRRACGRPESLRIQVEMGQFPDGRDSVLVGLDSVEAFAEFEMALGNYFDKAVLARVARHAWSGRVPRELVRDRLSTLVGVESALN